MDRARFARIGFLGLVALLTPSWAKAQSEKPATGQEAVAHAELRDATAKPVGSVEISETPHGLILVAKLTSVPEGTRAFHIHDAGKCDAPSFESAGPHFNPGGHKHGFAAEPGMHAGDLPNLDIPQTGLEATYFVPDVTLQGGKMALLDGNGASLVVHQKGDDYRTDPSGDAGGRIACGVIEPGPAASEKTAQKAAGDEASNQETASAK